MNLSTAEVNLPVKSSSHQAMVFIDGTNLFHRLAAENLRMAPSGLHRLSEYCSLGAEVVRICLYTSAPHMEKARQMHAAGFDQSVRVTLGDAVPTGDGNFREKGVDALMVADLVYHAARGNIDRAILVSADTDFSHAIRRVEDFGCRTAVVAVCAPVPDRLRQATDVVFDVNAGLLEQRQVCLGRPMQPLIHRA